MAVSEREKIHYELLEALYKARKQVEYLEAALAHNAAFLGTGVEREDFAAPPPEDSDALPEELMRYLGLVGREADVSDYLGIEGDNASRPRLGQDAPDYIRPRTEPRVGRLVGLLALGHPDDGLVLPGLATSAPAPQATGQSPRPGPAPQPGPVSPPAGQSPQPAPDAAAAPQSSQKGLQAGGLPEKPSS